MCEIERLRCEVYLAEPTYGNTPEPAGYSVDANHDVQIALEEWVENARRPPVSSPRTTPAIAHGRKASLSIHRKPSSTIECKPGNGDRAISPQRESRRISAATPAHPASLVPFWRELIHRIAAQFGNQPTKSLHSGTGWQRGADSNPRNLCGSKRANCPQHWLAFRP
jgi:hypothetical protein